MKKFLVLSFNTDDETHLLYNNRVIEIFEASVTRFEIVNEVIKRHRNFAKHIGQPYIPILVDGKQDGGIAID